MFLNTCRIIVVIYILYMYYYRVDISLKSVCLGLVSTFKPTAYGSVLHKNFIHLLIWLTVDVNLWYSCHHWTLFTQLFVDSDSSLLWTRWLTHLRREQNMRMNTWSVKRSFLLTGLWTFVYFITHFFLYKSKIWYSFCLDSFISVPKDMGTFNCGAFVAGIVKVEIPVLVTADFNHFVGAIYQHYFLTFCRVY